MNKLKLIVFLVSFLLVFCVQSNACECAGSGTPCQDYWNASAVFTGSVSYSSTTTYKLGEHEISGRLVRFTVERAFRGIEGKEVEVITGLGGGDCGYGFRLGQQYLVYAHSSEDKLFTSICSGTRPLSEAANDLSYIQGLAKAEPGATIFGQVKRLDRDEEGRLEPLSHVKILIEGPAKRVEIKTDEKGNYEVSRLPPGTYKVTIELPDGLSIHNPESEAKVVDRGCAQVSFWVQADTRITGKVLDAQGQPASDVLMELVPVTGEGGHYPSSVTTDKEGRYEMKLLPPGRYLLGVRIYGLASSTYVPFPRTYYPGVSQEDQATVISLNKGQRLDLSELILPPRFVERILDGIVIDTDGNPVNGATVWLKEKQYADHDMPYRRDTDSEGRFSFKVFEGINYLVHAYLEVPNSERKQAEPVAVRISSNPETLRLVLTRPK
jgi:protocatechuate 3,4-dioxygenase beta subunit